MQILPKPRVVSTLVVLLLALVMAHAQQSDTGNTAGNIEVLSDTKGVDFGPYLSDVLKIVRANWYNLIPEEARPPQLMPGLTSIEFAILANGNLAGLRIARKSGSVALDRAAWSGLTAGNPYPPLPEQYKAPYLALRFHFYYNPKKLSPEDRPKQDPAAASPQNPSHN